MNGIDLGIIGIMLFSSALGIWRGVTKEALGLVSWIGAGVAAYILLPVARHFSGEYIHNPVIADIVAALVIFITFLVFFSLISHIIASYVKESYLGGIDRALGFGFGIGRGIFVLAAFELAMSSFIPRAQYPLLMQQARFMGMVQSASETLLALLPKDAQDFVMTKQLKFMQEQAKKDLESHIDAVIEDKVKDGVSQAMEGMMGMTAPSSGNMQAPTQTQGSTGRAISTPNAVHSNSHVPQVPANIAVMQPSGRQELKPAEKLDTKKATEKLAQFKIQAQPKKENQGYRAEQRGDLDRLIETVR